MSKHIIGEQPKMPLVDRKLRDLEDLATKGESG